jgi:hypothetical protein
MGVVRHWENGGRLAIQTHASGTKLYAICLDAGSLSAGLMKGLAGFIRDESNCCVDKILLVHD